MIKIDKIIIEIGYDEMFDSSYFDDPQDKADLESGKIFLVYVKAKAEVSYPFGQKNRRIEWLSSGGLYGITISNINDPYLKEVTTDQLAELKDHLKMFNVDISNFNRVKTETKYKGL